MAGVTVPAIAHGPKSPWHCMHAALRYISNSEHTLSIDAARIAIVKFYSGDHVPYLLFTNFELSPQMAHRIGSGPGYSLRPTHTVYIVPAVYYYMGRAGCASKTRSCIRWPLARGETGTVGGYICDAAKLHLYDHGMPGYHAPAGIGRRGWNVHVSLISVLSRGPHPAVVLPIYLRKRPQRPFR